MNFWQFQFCSIVWVMADKSYKNPLNRIGVYYNDLTCIDCGMCPEIAPEIFRRDDEEGYSYVWKQPVTPEEIALARDAVDSCPTMSIGDDG